jgi:hypothetical protein
MIRLFMGSPSHNVADTFFLPSRQNIFEMIVDMNTDVNILLTGRCLENADKPAFWRPSNLAQVNLSNSLGE